MDQHDMRLQRAHTFMRKLRDVETAQVVDGLRGREDVCNVLMGRTTCTELQDSNATVQSEPSHKTSPCFLAVRLFDCRADRWAHIYTYWRLMSIGCSKSVRLSANGALVPKIPVKCV